MEGDSFGNPTTLPMQVGEHHNPSEKSAFPTVFQGLLLSGREPYFLRSKQAFCEHGGEMTGGTQGVREGHRRAP